MRKFIVLLTKEIKELLTLQMILPLLISVVVFIFIGNILGSETQKAIKKQDIVVLDSDTTSGSQGLVKVLTDSGFNVTLFTDMDADQAVKKAQEKNVSTLLVIPKGFEKGISNQQPQVLKTYSIVRQFSVMGSVGAKSLSMALSAMNEYMSNQYINSKIPGANPADLKNPIKTKDFVVIGDRKAATTMDQVTGFIMSQTVFVPIVIFLVILMSSQMLAVTIASEKENKTLETLLSTPVTRLSLVAAKMVAAGLVSLVAAAFYMVGFTYYMNEITGGAMGQTSAVSREIIEQLGLSINPVGYLFLGTSIFLSILIALAISLILGTFAEDVKKVQGLVAPLTFLIMIPYIVSMFVDLNNASPAIKYLVYAIPFSHTFFASPNIFLRNYTPVIYGMIYQLALFFIFLYIAVRIFSTDKILTMKLNFKRTSLFRL